MSDVTRGPCRASWSTEGNRRTIDTPPSEGTANGTLGEGEGGSPTPQGPGAPAFPRLSGFLAVFDGPGRAVRCACAIRDAVRAIGIQVRVGLHTGEIELRGDDIGGIAVHIAQRVQTLAEPDEVLVSRTVADLVSGSGIAFADRGTYALKGVPNQWQLFAVEDPRPGFDDAAGELVG